MAKKAKKLSSKKATKTSKKKVSKKKAQKKVAAKKSTGRKSTAARKTAPGKKALPKVGQHVKWKALPGMVFGTVVAILTKDSELNGKKVKASPEAPRIKLKSDSSGKLCVHKPENVTVA